MNKGSKTKRLYTYILKDLYKNSSGLYAFTLYKRYGITPKDLFKFIKKYEEEEVLVYKDGRLTITNKGNDVIYSKIFFDKGSAGLESNLRIGYSNKKIDLDTPYIPILKYLGDDLE